MNFEVATWDPVLNNTLESGTTFKGQVGHLHDLDWNPFLCCDQITMAVQTRMTLSYPVN